MLNVLNFDTRIANVYSIFQEYFGEDHVDLQFMPNFKRLVIDTINNQSNNSTAAALASIGALRHYDGMSNEFYSDLNEGISLGTIIEKYPESIEMIIVEFARNKFDLSIDSVAKILVYFPKVKIENEYGDSTIIKELWVEVRLKIGGLGMGFFGLNRSHYTYNHFRNNYLHSHIKNIPKSDFTFFDAPCLGKGPINSTVNSLSISYDESLWNLFCLELDRYVRTESIIGIPYNKLTLADQVATSRVGGQLVFEYLAMKPTIKIDANRIAIPELLDKIIENKLLKFSLNHNTIVLGMSWWDYLLAISNAYIEIINEKTKNLPLHVRDTIKMRVDGVLIEAIKKDGKFYRLESTGTVDISNYIGETICTFKGEEITLKIDDKATETDNYVLLMSPNVAGIILFRILDYLNYERNRRQANSIISPNDSKVTFL